jgi:hypothetical protein
MRVIGSSRIHSSGVFVQGLSTDPKPSGLAIGSRFKEVDTGKEFALTELGWLLDIIHNANQVWDIDTMDWVAMVQPQLNAENVNIDLTATNAILDDILDATLIPIQYMIYLEEYSATIMFIGEAPPGSSVDSAVWRIKRVDTSAGIAVLWADGNPLFDNRWDQRTLKEYS